LASLHGRLCLMTEGTAAVPSWYSVRTVYLLPGFKKKLYEERITVWRTTSMTEAIELAEVEAHEYEGEQDVDGRPSGPKYLGLAQGYATSIEGDSLDSADELFSLIRSSKLRPQAYLDAFFDTGSERQTKIKSRSKKKRAKRPK
jgi:hypothetical protein